MDEPFQTLNLLRAQHPDLQVPVEIAANVDGRTRNAMIRRGHITINDDGSWTLKEEV
tara:strand:- start:475 stop:645 length:171 start_codon:yes stop_codon:yes gene_type:complete